MRKKDKKIISVIVALILVVLAAFFKDDIKHDETVTLENGNIGVYFVDVGQGHCTVIQSGENGAIIDTGEREYSSTVLDFLKSRGINNIEFIIATHPHSDHIGSMGTVITKTKPKDIYMPYIAEENLPTNKTYLNFLTSIDENNVRAHFLNKKTELKLGDVSFTVIPPAKQIDDMNNMSLITKISFGDISFLIAGDAEKKEMTAVLSANKGFDFSADFYLMAHHGSSTSTYEAFLNKVNFKEAVISCGKDNDYGHPHKEALSYLEKYSVRYYRTDETGTVSVITDGQKCNVKTEKG